MGIPARLLGDGEHVVTSTRTHVKALLWPAFLLIVVCGAAGLLAGLVPQDPPLLVWLIWGVAAVAVGWWVVRPFLRWLGASYTLTNHRLVTRRGVLTRVGHDIPLHRVNDVSYEYGLVDRVLGCGTLVISAASERGQVILPDVPAVEELHLAMTELLMDTHDRGYDDGHHDGGDWFEPDTRRRR